MTRENIKKLLTLLGCRNFIDYDNFVFTNCPRAFFTHKDGDDKHKSFGVSVSEGKSFFNCFACGRGDLISLVSGILFNKNFSIEERKQLYGLLDTECAEDILIDSNINCINFDNFQEFSSFKEEDFSRQLKEYISIVESKEGIDYLLSRGISLDVIKSFNLFFDIKQKAIIFPLELNNKVLGLHCRSILKKKFYYIKHYLYNIGVLQKGLWYNYNKINFSEPVILVESPIDVLFLASLGFFNVIASCGSLSKDNFLYVFPSYIGLGFDCDITGQKYNNYTLKILQSQRMYNFFSLDWSSFGGKDPSDCKDLAGLKQYLNNILKRELKFTDKFYEKFDIFFVQKI